MEDKKEFLKKIFIWKLLYQKFTRAFERTPLGTKYFSTFEILC